MAFIQQMRLERAPSGVEEALSHRGFEQLGGRHLPDNDDPLVFDKPGAELVQSVFATASAGARSRKNRLGCKVSNAGSESAVHYRSPTLDRSQRFGLESVLEGCGGCR